MAPPKTAKGNVDAKKGNTITEYFKAGKPRSKAKNPLTEEQKLKRFKEGSLLLDPYYYFTFDFQNYLFSSCSRAQHVFLVAGLGKLLGKCNLV